MDTPPPLARRQGRKHKLASRRRTVSVTVFFSRPRARRHVCGAAIRSTHAVEFPMNEVICQPRDSPVPQNTLARDYSLLPLLAGALAHSNASSAILASCTATPVLSKITSPRGRTRGPSSHAPNSTTASLWIRPEEGCTQRSSVAISGNQLSSVAIGGNEWEARRGIQRHSVALVPARMAC